MSDLDQVEDEFTEIFGDDDDNKKEEEKKEPAEKEVAEEVAKLEERGEEVLSAEAKLRADQQVSDAQQAETIRVREADNRADERERQLEKDLEFDSESQVFLKDAESGMVCVVKDLDKKSKKYSDHRSKEIVDWADDHFKTNKKDWGN